MNLLSSLLQTIYDEWIVFDDIKDDASFNIPSNTPLKKFIYYVDGNNIRIGDMTKYFSDNNAWYVSEAPSTIDDILGAKHSTDGSIKKPDGINSGEFKYIYGFKDTINNF